MSAVRLLKRCGKNLDRLLRYGGWRFHCPLCNGRFRRLAPHGQNDARRENACCPGCGSIERERHLLLYLQRETSVFTEPLRFLHIAPEPRLHRILKQVPTLDYLTGDLNPERAMVRVDLTEIPFQADSFDLILCSHVLEHIPEDRKAMAELRRVLRPTGRAVLLVPAPHSRETTYEDWSLVTPEERTHAFGKWDQVRRYGKHFMIRLEEAGFTVDPYNFAASVGEAAARKYGLRLLENLYICGDCTRNGGSSVKRSW